MDIEFLLDNNHEIVIIYYVPELNFEDYYILPRSLEGIENMNIYDCLDHIPREKLRSELLNGIISLDTIDDNEEYIFMKGYITKPEPLFMTYGIINNNYGWIPNLNSNPSEIMQYLEQEFPDLRFYHSVEELFIEFNHPGNCNRPFNSEISDLILRTNDTYLLLPGRYNDYYEYYNELRIQIIHSRARHMLETY